VNELTHRQRAVLGIVVATHVKTGRPVGSEALAEYYEEALSPATIRNVLHELEELQFISQPYHSAGRVPTDKGYRCYVDDLMSRDQIEPHVASIVAREYRSPCDNIESLLERTATILSDLSVQAGLIMFPDFEALVLKRVELTWLGRSHLLVVWVTESGFVQNRVIETKADIPDKELGRLSGFLTQELDGMLLDEVLPYLDRKAKEVTDARYTLYQTGRALLSEVFHTHRGRKLSVDGSRHILEQPEFQNLEKSRRLFHVLERGEILLDLLRADLEREGVQVHIGVEHNCSDIWDCSFVTARYQLNRRTIGTLGVMGPRRMQYGRIVPLVDYVARRLGETLEKW